MKILMVSIFRNHFFNWVLQLKDAGHEIYWIDSSGANTYNERIGFVNQTVDWTRKYDYPGRYWLKKKLPFLEKFLEKFNRQDFKRVFEKKLLEIQPDVVQSFEIHSSAVPILEIMKRHPKIKWIYSSWGNDLYYYQNETESLKNIRAVLGRIHYMFADCERDLSLARKYDFKGQYLGTFPGGGGYDLETNKYKVGDFCTDKKIVIKGYQHIFGRAIYVLEALLKIKNDLKDYQIVVFAANSAVLEYLKKPEFADWQNLQIKGRIGRGEVLSLMGHSNIYIGNNISDGMANTLLEAIIMETFPIQSNPGGATAEIIEHGKNGYLIENPEDSDEIATLIKMALNNPQLVESAIAYNTEHLKPKLERNYIKNLVVEQYERVQQALIDNKI